MTVLLSIVDLFMSYVGTYQQEVKVGGKKKCSLDNSSQKGHNSPFQND